MGTDYYPFGLTMVGISSKALSFGSPANKKNWNVGSELESKEFTDGSGLELYSTFYRSLDPQLGRFWQIDPEIELQESFSPYESMGNNPISNVDPLGDFKTRFGAWWHRTWHGGGTIGRNKYDEWYVTKGEVVSENGGIVAKSHRYYGKNRNAYSTAKETWLNDQHVDWDIKMNGENSMYQWYASDKDAGFGAATLGTGVVLPNPFYKSSTIWINQIVNSTITRKIAKTLNNTISVQKQARHLAGKANQQGGFLNSIDDAQAVLDAVHAGKATYLGTTKSGQPVFQIDAVTGTNVNLGVGISNQPTNTFMIKGTTSVSVVPISPVWKP